MRPLLQCIPPIRLFNGIPDKWLSQVSLCVGKPAHADFNDITIALLTKMQPSAETVTELSFGYFIGFHRQISMPIWGFFIRELAEHSEKEIWFTDYGMRRNRVYALENVLMKSGGHVVEVEDGIVALPHHSQRMLTALQHIDLAIFRVENSREGCEIVLKATLPELSDYLGLPEVSALSVESERQITNLALLHVESQRDLG
jgi:hypothetical protein